MQAILASVGRRWIRAFCEDCGEQTQFDVHVDWVLVCVECSKERHLEPNGLLAPIDAAA